VPTTRLPTAFANATGRWPVAVERETCIESVEKVVYAPRKPTIAPSACGAAENLAVCRGQCDEQAAVVV
jgi:hypothetical protein